MVSKALFVALALVVVGVQAQSQWPKDLLPKRSSVKESDYGFPHPRGVKFQIDRNPMLPDAVEKLQDQNTGGSQVSGEHPECTAIYTVTLNGEWTTQGNDLGMLPPHGKNTLSYRDNVNFRGIPVTASKIGGDYTNFPFADSVEKQAQAKSQFSVTALTEDLASPLGFKSDVVHYGHAVCVNIMGVEERWVEIMAESDQPNQQLCVSDWKKENLPENPIQETCANGNLFVCRESNNERNSAGTVKDEMKIKFFCRDSCDDPDFSFYWRVTASQEVPLCVETNNNGDCTEYEQPDGENWCAMREGDDYPSSLVQPYPEEYDPPAVFDFATAGASQVVFSAAVVLSLTLFGLLF